MLFLKTSSTIMNSHLYHCLFKMFRSLESLCDCNFDIFIVSWIFSSALSPFFPFAKKENKTFELEKFFFLIHLLYVWIIVFFSRLARFFWLFNWINRRVRDTCTKKRLNFLTTTFPSLGSCVRNKWIYEKVRFSWLKTFTF